MKKYSTYTYEDALARYQLALVNAIVKQAKNSEKAYICLKAGWLMRGYAEWLLTDEGKAYLHSNPNLKNHPCNP